MAITPLPPAPEPTDSTSEFNSKAFAFVGALDGFVTETNALAVQVDADAAVAAEGAEAAEAALAAANFKGEWSTLTGALAIPASVSHNGSVWVLTQSLADVTSNEPGVDSPNYWINVTIPPAGASGNVLTSDGTNWTSAAPPSSGALLASQVFTSSGTFTIPSGVTKLKITVVGGGGGGGGGLSSGTFAPGNGGGGGGASITYLSSLTSGNTIGVTVGAAGAGGAAATSGTAGGTSSVQSGTETITTRSATGGGGGTAGLTATGEGGTGSGGTINLGGSDGFQASALDGQAAGGNGGNSMLGGGGRGARGGGANRAGKNYGGGGGGGWTNSSGSSGAAGVIIFEW